MKKLLCLLAITCASPAVASDYTDKIVVPPGLVYHWTAPKQFKDAVVGNTDVVDALPGTNRDLVIQAKSEGGITNIILLDEDNKQIANVLVINPGRLRTEMRQGPNGFQVFRKDNPDYVPPKEKK